MPADKHARPVIAQILYRRLITNGTCSLCYWQCSDAGRNWYQKYRRRLVLEIHDILTSFLLPVGQYLKLALDTSHCVTSLRECCCHFMKNVVTLKSCIRLVPGTPVNTLLCTGMASPQLEHFVDLAVH